MFPIGYVLYICVNHSKAHWKNHNELKQQVGNASIIGEKRVVFNIHGNKYRLIVEIEYRCKLFLLCGLVHIMSTTKLMQKL